MRTVLILSLLFLAGCSFFPKKETSAPVETEKLTTKEQAVHYVDRIMVKTDWLTTICLLGAGVGVFGFLSGNGWGLKLTAACASVVCSALILASAAAWIAVATKWIIILAIVSAVVALGILAYSIFVKGKAVKEIVKNVQKIKETVTDGVFDSDASAEISVGIREILSEQSPSTKAIVSEIKKSLPKPKI